MPASAQALLSLHSYCNPTITSVPRAGLGPNHLQEAISGNPDWQWFLLPWAVLRRALPSFGVSPQRHVDFSCHEYASCHSSKGKPLEAACLLYTFWSYNALDHVWPSHRTGQFLQLSKLWSLASCRRGVNSWLSSIWDLWLRSDSQVPPVASVADKRLVTELGSQRCWLNGSYCHDRFGYFFSFFLSPSLFRQNSGCWCENNAEILIRGRCATYTGRHVLVVTDHTPCNSITFENETPSHHGCAFSIYASHLRRCLFLFRSCACSAGITWEPLSSTESHAALRIYRVGICIVTRSAGDPYAR